MASTPCPANLKTGTTEHFGPHISWEAYHMALALLFAGRSERGCARAGSCIAMKDHRHLSFGYNTRVPKAMVFEDDADVEHYEECSSHINVLMNLQIPPLTCSELSLYTTHCPVHSHSLMSLRQTPITEMRYLRSDGEIPSMRQRIICPACNIKQHSVSNGHHDPLVAELERLILDDGRFQAPFGTPDAIVASDDAFFMAVAWLAAQRSSHPTTQVGVCLVDAAKRIISISYSCSNPLQSNGCNLQSVDYHAESTAILMRTSDSAVGTTMYCTLFPCWWCADWLVRSKVSRVVYLDAYESYKNANCKAVCQWLQTSGVQVQRVKLEELKLLKILEEKSFKLRLKMVPNAQLRRLQPAVEDLISNDSIAAKFNGSSCHSSTNYVNESNGHQ